MTEEKIVETWAVLLENEDGYHIEEVTREDDAVSFMVRLTMTDRIVDWFKSRERAEEVVTGYLQDG